MKYTAVFILLVCTAFLSCNKDCEVNKPACNETPPEGQTCMAYFERWFYDQDTESCTFKSYSGCSESGFASKEECRECECK